MNFSLQTVILLFLVTVVHIAVIVSIAPLDESGIGILSRIDAEVVKDTTEPAAELAGGIDLRENGTEPIPGFPGQEMDQLRAQPLATESESAPREPQSIAAEARPKEVVAQSQAYSGRVEKPELTEGEGSRGSGQTALRETALSPAPAEAGRGIREIRPVAH